MSSMLQEFVSAARSIGSRIAFAWDWPTVPGNDFTSEERQRLRDLSLYFSTIAAIGAGGLATVKGAEPVNVVTLSAVSVLAGHYLACVVSNIQHRRHRKSRHKIPKL
jgi:hypothetical protein